MNIGDFPYGLTNCGLKCNTSAKSPLRQGSPNNVYAIPAPTYLSFGTATLLSSACGILSALLLVSLWNKVLEINWRMRFGNPDILNLPVEGTNAEPFPKIRSIKKTARLALSNFELPLLIATTLAILILGEINFLSAQVRFQTEPMATFGELALLDVHAPLTLLSRSMGPIGWSCVRISGKSLYSRLEGT